MNLANVYKIVLSVIKDFRAEADFPFRELNYKFLNQFEHYCTTKNNTINTISVYVRTIRAIYNRAIKEGVATKEMYPFSDYKIKTQKTKKRAVRREVIEKIENLELPENSRIWHAQNYFLFSFYMMGISFIDLAYLKVENIFDGRIEYVRKKTKKSYNIKITPKAQKNLDFYLDGKQNGDYIFPIIRRKESPELVYRDSRNRAKEYNDKLKEIAEKCNIETAFISEGLGHETERTTQIYLDSFEKEVLDDLNEMITE